MEIIKYSRLPFILIKRLYHQLEEKKIINQTYCIGQYPINIIRLNCTDRYNNDNAKSMPYNIFQSNLSQ